MKVMVCVVGAAVVGVNLAFEPLPVQGCPACAPGPLTRVISLRTQQRHCVSRGTRQPGQRHSAQAGTCQNLQGLGPAQGSAPCFPEPWAGVNRQARQAAFVWGQSGDCTANHLVFWATGAIWS